MNVANKEKVVEVESVRIAPVGVAENAKTKMLSQPTIMGRQPWLSQKLAIYTHLAVPRTKVHFRKALELFIVSWPFSFAF